MKALVTGGGGFIGSHLVERLVRDGHEVRALDNFSTGRRANLAHLLDEIELVEGDIQSYERASTAVRACEVVFHQAALPSVPRSVQDPLTSNASNVIGTLNVLLAARDAGVRRVIFASSSSVYGANPALPKQETMASEPISPYAAAKLAGENYCRSFREVYGLDTVALRYFNVFGPRQDPTSQYSAVIPKFIAAFLAGDPPTIYGDGEQSRDFTYIDNVVHANLLAATSPRVEGFRFNIACGERFTLNRLAAELRELTESDARPRYARVRPGDVPHSQADISAAREALGYRPEVSFREGLYRTVAHHREWSYYAPSHSGAARELGRITAPVMETALAQRS
ncbi:MAG TPA: SDR family oxidoreductase [Solirubrobacteraceae bacterium]|nr:SDR family oxidoreductase [Solirubrobacteraceae bacterium]